MLQKCASFGAVLRQRFVVEVLGGRRIEAEIELIFPAEFEAGFAQRVVALLRAGMPFRQIGRMRGDLVGDDAVLHVLLIRQARDAPSA